MSGNNVFQPEYFPTVNPEVLLACQSILEDAPEFDLDVQRAADERVKHLLREGAL